MSQAGDLDMALLSSLVRRKRDRLGLSLREAAEQIQTSAPTLQRVEAGQQPNASTIVRIADWLEVSMDDLITNRKGGVARGETVDQIEVLLRADKNLDNEAAGALADIVRQVYSGFMRKKHGK